MQSILSKYPDLNAVINYDWSSTKSAYSLSQALKALSPDVVVDVYPSDCFIDKSFFDTFFSTSSPRIACYRFAEERSRRTVNLKLNDNNTIEAAYTGIINSQYDPEVFGIFRAPVNLLQSAINDQQSKYRTLFATELLAPYLDFSFQSIDCTSSVSEINSAIDFLRFRDNQFVF